MRKTTLTIIASTLTVIALMAFVALTPAEGDHHGKKLKVLLVTGGGWHDYPTQSKILKEGLEERINCQAGSLHQQDDLTALAIAALPTAAAARSAA